MTDTSPSPNPESPDPQVPRGRPGRRTVEDRKEAVLALLSGKATVDQLAQKYGVYPATVEGWRDEALKAVETTFRQGQARTEQDRVVA